MDSIYRVLLINPKENIVLIPNSSEDDYAIISNILFQSETGSFGVPVNNCAKGPCFEPNLKLGKNTISFNIKYDNTISSVKIENLIW